MSRTLSSCLVVGLWLACFGVGCATTPHAPRPVPLLQAEEEIPTEELLDVVVSPLEPGLPEDPAEIADDVFPEVRKAESRFIATHLKKTLESSGYWGSVNVAPASDDVGLKVEGEILESNGETLAVEIKATDVTGREWLDRKYESRLPVAFYRMPAEEQTEPFQDLYDRIANDIAAAREALSARERVEIDQVADLRFAANLAPDAFGGRLETDEDGRTRVRRLPARDDAMLEHVRAVQDRDQALRELLDESYLEFYEGLEEPYQRWRSFTAEEIVALRRVRNGAYQKMGLGALAIAGAFVLAAFDGGLASELLLGPMLAGGIYGTTAGIQALNETSIHVESITELGNSFDADVAPRVVEVQGETVRLSGNAEAQYAEWRRLLRAIYRAETGLPVADLEAPGESEPMASDEVRDGG